MSLRSHSSSSTTDTSKIARPKISVFQALILLIKIKKQRLKAIEGTFDEKKKDELSRFIKELKFLAFSGSMGALGIVDELINAKINYYLRDPELAGFEIIDDFEMTNKDHVRRYFESVFTEATITSGHALASFTLGELQDLQLLLEKRFPSDVIQRIDEIFNGNFSCIMESKDKNLPTMLLPAMEYADIWQKLKGIELSHVEIKTEEFSLDKASPAFKHFENFSGVDREKMAILIRVAYLVTALVNYEKVPLDIYPTEPLYQPHNRGRIFKDLKWQAELKAARESCAVVMPKEQAEQDLKEGQENVFSHAMGILYSMSPAPRGSRALADTPIVHAKEKKALAQYLSPFRFPIYRGPDRSTCIGGAMWVELVSKFRVAPFNNAISGTMLMHLRALKALTTEMLKETSLEIKSLTREMKVHSEIQAHSEIEKKGESRVNATAHLTKEPSMGLTFLYDTDKFQALIRCIVATLHYTLGGHPLHEFVYPIFLPEIQKGFAHLEGFDKITLRSLFETGNEEALELAFEDTIHYCLVLIDKQKVQSELLEGHTILRPTNKSDLSEQKDREVRPALLINSDFIIRHYHSPPRVGGCGFWKTTLQSQYIAQYMRKKLAETERCKLSKNHFS